MEPVYVSDPENTVVDVPSCAPVEDVCSGVNHAAPAGVSLASVVASPPVSVEQAVATEVTPVSVITFPAGSTPSIVAYFAVPAEQAVTSGISPVSVVTSPAGSTPSCQEFIDHQCRCVESAALANSPSLRLHPEQDGLITHLSQGGRHVVVPVTLRRQVFDAVHVLSHPGVKATQRLLCRDYRQHHRLQPCQALVLPLRPVAADII